MDATPTTAAQMSALQRYTTGPVWNGYQVAGVMSNCYAKLPDGSIAVDVDCTKFEKPWYSYVDAATFNVQSAASLPTANIFSPARLIVAGDSGTTATPGVVVGRLYASYVIELVQPEASAVNL